MLWSAIKLTCELGRTVHHPYLHEWTIPVGILQLVRHLRLEIYHHCFQWPVKKMPRLEIMYIVNKTEVDSEYGLSAMEAREMQSGLRTQLCENWKTTVKESEEYSVWPEPHITTALSDPNRKYRVLYTQRVVFRLVSQQQRPMSQRHLAILSMEDGQLGMW